MGRVKNAVIKNIGNNLIEAHPNKFNDNFEKNKETVDSFLSVESKSMRNKIAGYITHEMKKSKKLKTRKISYDAGPSPVKKRKKK